MILTFRYAEFIIVPELQYLVKIPDSIPLSIAAMLPTGALLAMNTVFKAHEYVHNILQERGDNGLFSENLYPTVYFIRLVSCLSSDGMFLVYTVPSLGEKTFILVYAFMGSVHSGYSYH
jgi:NADPH:quinone reductase and related Zn-dependent oxidoreductases